LSPLMDAVLLLPYALRGTGVNGLIHSVPLTIHRTIVINRPVSYNP